jgi:hypothetical protein
MISAVLIGDPDSTPIEIEKTTSVRWQIKNRVKSRIESINTEISKPSNNLPILTVVLELGSLRKSNRPLVEVVSKARRETKGYSVEKDAEAHHYMIVAHGCTSETYGSIPSTCNNLYKAILASDKLIDDFPRNQLENERALYRQKPGFYGDLGEVNGSWGWRE